MTGQSNTLAVYESYIGALRALMRELHQKPHADGDPLLDFSAWLVTTLTRGTRTATPHKSSWDVHSANGERIRVKYLVNAKERWDDEHLVLVSYMIDSYALVVFECFLPQAVIIFPARRLAAVGRGLGRREDNLDTMLRFSHANYHQLLNKPSFFKALGIKLYLPTDWVLR